MPRLKRWFITPYLLAVTAALAFGLWSLFQGQWGWGALVLSSFPTFVVTVFHVLWPHRARTPRRYPSFVILALAGLGGSLLGWPDLGAPLTALGLLGGLLAYLYWYSEFGTPKSTFLQPGQKLPKFQALVGGQAVDSSTLSGAPALILFYRGNWCPVCTSQIHELAAHYQELSKRGIRVILISPQPETHSADLAKKVNLPFEFWEDRGNRAAQTLKIVDPAGLPLGMEALGYGSDTPLPTAILIDANSVVLYSDQAENYRIRPEPQQYLAAFDGSVTAR